MSNSGGLGDGGAHVSIISDGSFPTYLLSHWGRDRDRDRGRFDIGWLVKRQTADTARAVGLLDRGRVAPGYKADLNVIDLAALQWLMFQMGGIGPMFGQLGSFHKFAGKDYEDKRPRDRYVAACSRLLGVLDKHLAGRAWMLGNSYSIADIAIWPWVRNLVGFYGVGELVQIEKFTHVSGVLADFVARPAVQRGLLVPPAPPAPSLT